MTRRWSFINRTLRALCLLAAFLCLTALIWETATWIQGRRANSAMRELYDPAAHAEEVQPNPDFLPLLEANGETVGWLQTGETMNFAIVQRDNEYYLNHNFFGEYTQEGTAFLDEGSCILPRDEHLLIHGHNMRNGAVFGELDSYRSLEYLQKHPVVTFNSLYEDGQYVPFAVLDISAEPGNANFFDMQIFDFASDEDFDAFVSSARERSYFEIPVDVRRGDALAGDLQLF